ncbi:hypothetical protein INT43_000907, partial [Umbelopsis isabellina]
WDLDDQAATSPSKVSKTDDSHTENEASNHATTANPGKAKDADSAASEAAARINALLAQKGIDAKTGSETGEGPDGEFYKDIPINDIKNRYMLTRGATQTMIQQETGADVTTRGKYYPDKNLATERDPPLFLHITATTKEVLDAAVAKIQEMIDQGVMPTPPAPITRAPPQRTFLEHKVPVGIEGAPHFNIRAKIIGPQGSYVKHIQSETGARVQLKGRGSGFVESATGVEADEPLYMHITCARQDGLDKAAKLSEDLLKTVKDEWERFQQQPPQYGRGYGRGSYGHGPPQHHGNYGYQQYGAPPPPPVNPPLPPGPPPPPPSGAGPDHTSPPPPPPAGVSEHSASPAAPDASYGQYGSQSPATPATAGANGYPADAYAGYGQYDQYNQYGQYGQYNQYGQYSQYGQYDPYSQYDYSQYYATQPGATDGNASAATSQPPPTSTEASPSSAPPPPSDDQDYHAVPPPPQL